MSPANQTPKNQQDTVLPVDGDFLLDISDDNLMVVLVELIPPSNGGASVTPDDVMTELKEQKIDHGIDYEKIQNLVSASAHISDGMSDAERFCIAKGNPAVDGEDGELVWQVEEALLASGDCAVLPGEQVAIYKPATSGKQGCDVFGNVISPTGGKNDFPRIGTGITTTKTEEGDEYRAACYGAVKYSADESGEMIDVDNGIVVTDDGMEARMDIFAQSSAGQAVECAHIVATLEAQGIKHGVDQSAIQEAIDKARNLSKANGVGWSKSVVVATGTPPQEGKDARLIISRDDNSVGLELANGRMNYHERDYPWNVSAGEKIGYLLEAKPAVEGIPVYGGKIEVATPKEIEVKLVGAHKDDKGKIVADMDGALLIDGFNLEVVDLLAINGDVGPQTGNVRSKTPVHVKGHVAAGFVLESDKDVIVERNIEDATVRSGGMVIIKGGIRGMKSQLFSPGDVNVGYIEHASVFVNSDLVVTGSVMNSTVASNGSIIVGNKKAKKSLVVGGELTAHTSVEVVTLGSPAYAKTHIRLGMAQEQRREINNIDKEIEAREEDIARLGQIESHHIHYPKDDTEEMLGRIAATREVKQTEISELEEKKAELMAIVKESDSVKVVVHKCVYPGVTVTINDSSYEVSHELGAGTFVFDKEQNKVTFQPD